MVPLCRRQLLHSAARVLAHLHQLLEHLNLHLGLRRPAVVYLGEQPHRRHLAAQPPLQVCSFRVLVLPLRFKLPIAHVSDIRAVTVAAFGGGGFGSTGSAPAFGAASSAASAFGAASSPAFGTSAFGGGGFGAASTPASSSAFGGGSFSNFGATPTSTSVFGATQAAPAFGSTQPAPFGAASNPAFSFSSSSGFGATSTPFVSSNAFGAASIPAPSGGERCR